MKEKTLDEKGFVFIDGDGRPYWCRMYNDEPWFLYWHEGSKAWVKLRKVTQSEIWFANEKKINNEHAQAYHDLHEKFINGGIIMKEKTYKFLEIINSKEFYLGFIAGMLLMGLIGVILISYFKIL